MTSERERRIGHNEALYRQVNERIEELNEAFSTVAEDFAIICECGDLECMEQLEVSQAVYEATRRDPIRFIVKPGHEVPDVERVVDRDAAGKYVVLEKDTPAAKRIAEETDPRS